MPRIKQYKEKYMAQDFSAWVIGQMFLRHLSQKDVAEVLSITQQALSKKLKTNKFDVSEVIKLFHLFETDKETISKLLTYEGSYGE